LTTAKAKLGQAVVGRGLSQETESPAEAVLTPTPTRNSIEQRLAEFSTMTEALEYAAQGETGFNFYDARGNLKSVLPFKTLMERSRHVARYLLAKGLESGSHVALVADTTPEFVTLFFACRYAGLVPYAMPIPVNLGSHAAYVRHLHGMLDGGQAGIALANDDFVNFLK